MPGFTLHRCHNYVAEIGSVKRIVPNKDQSRLLIVKSVEPKSKNRTGESLPPLNLVELWSSENPPQLYFRKTFGPLSASIECLLWCDNNGFIAGCVNGFVHYYAIHQYKPKYSLSVSAGPIWCGASNKNQTHFALGTEDGTIFILCQTQEPEESLIIGRRFHNVSSKRILSIVWSDRHKCIIAGSVNAIFIHKCSNGRLIHKINVVSNITGSGAPDKVSTYIWCLLVTENFTVISGDSKGFVNFWDGNTGLLLNRHQMSKADILCMCLTKDQMSVFCGGVDPRIQEYASSSKPSSSKDSRESFAVIDSSATSRDLFRKKRKRILTEEADSPAKYIWAPLGCYSLHDRDVLSLSLLKTSWLLSAGSDLSFGFRRLTAPQTYLLPAVTSLKSNISVCLQSKRVLYQYANKLEIWKLPSTTSPGSEKTHKSPVQKEARERFLVEMNSLKEPFIVAAAISGPYFCLCGKKSSKFFKLVQETDCNILVKKVGRNGFMAADLQSGVRYSFPAATVLTLNSAMAFLYDADSSSLYKVKLDDLEGEITELNLPRAFHIDKMRLLDDNKKLLTVATLPPKLALFDLDQGMKLASEVSLEKEIIDFQIRDSKKNPIVFLLQDDSSIAVFDIKTSLHHKTLLGLSLLPKTEHLAMIGISVSPSRNIMLHSSDVILFIKWDKRNPSGDRVIRSVKKYKDILTVSWLNEESIFLATAKKHQRLQSTPMNFGKFGTK